MGVSRVWGLVRRIYRLQITQTGSSHWLVAPDRGFAVDFAFRFGSDATGAS